MTHLVVILQQNIGVPLLSSLTVNNDSCCCPVCLSSGPNRGHYITIVKSHGFWLLFDDDIVEVSGLFCVKNHFILYTIPLPQTTTLRLLTERMTPLSFLTGRFL